MEQEFEDAFALIERGNKSLDSSNEFRAALCFFLAAKALTLQSSSTEDKKLGDLLRNNAIEYFSKAFDSFSKNWHDSEGDVVTMVEALASKVMSGDGHLLDEELTAARQAADRVFAVKKKQPRNFAAAAASSILTDTEELHESLEARFARLKQGQEDSPPPSSDHASIMERMKDLGCSTALELGQGGAVAVGLQMEPIKSEAETVDGLIAAVTDTMRLEAGEEGIGIEPPAMTAAATDAIPPQFTGEGDALTDNMATFGVNLEDAVVELREEIKSADGFEENPVAGAGAGGVDDLLKGAVALREEIKMAEGGSSDNKATDGCEGSSVVSGVDDLTSAVSQLRDELKTAEIKMAKEGNLDVDKLKSSVPGINDLAEIISQLSTIVSDMSEIVEEIDEGGVSDDDGDGTGLTKSKITIRNKAMNAQEKLKEITTHAFLNVDFF